MPRRDLPKKQEDPFRRINNWDDGMGSHGKDYDDRDRDRDRRSRHNRRQAYSSPSPSPVRRRRPSLDARATAPGGVPRSKDYFPQRHRDDDDYDRPRDSDRGHGRERDRDRHSDRDRDRDRYSSPSPRRHHRDRDNHHNRDRGLNSSYYDSHPANPHGRRDDGDIPPPKPPRPGLHRSKTTSAKERLASLAKVGTNLSPRWQKAATAAFQAGSMAALQARKQPGDWAGMKGAKVATAALGAMAMEGFARSAAEKSEKRDRSRDRDRDRDYRDKNRDRSRDRDRDYRDRDRDRDRDRGSGKGPSGKKNSDVEVLGDMLGGFIMDQWAKRGPNKARA